MFDMRSNDVLLRKNDIVLRTNDVSLWLNDVAPLGANFGKFCFAKLFDYIQERRLFAKVSSPHSPENYD